MRFALLLVGAWGGAALRDPCSEARYIVEIGATTTHDALPGVIATQLGRQGYATGWRVQRRSAAARSFPTDFAVVILDDDAENGLLAAFHASFKRVTRDHCNHRRKLQFGEESTQQHERARSDTAARRGREPRGPGHRPLRRKDRRDGLMEPEFAGAEGDDGEVAVDAAGSSSERTRRATKARPRRRRSLLGIALPAGHNLTLPPISEYLHASTLWGRKGGVAEGVKVAVFDSGVNKSHPNLHKVGASIDFTNGSFSTRGPAWSLLYAFSICASSLTRLPRASSPPLRRALPSRALPPPRRTRLSNQRPPRWTSLGMGRTSPPS